jgi:PilZ domain
MKTIKVIGTVDDHHRLVAEVPAKLPPGPVEVMLVVPPLREDEGDGTGEGTGAGRRPHFPPPLVFAPQPERREQDRVDFIQPVKLMTADGVEHNVLSRDLSGSGIRLIATRSFLGQKVDVLLPGAWGASPTWFPVRILWTCIVGDDLLENGGTFLENA